MQQGRWLELPRAPPTASGLWKTMETCGNAVSLDKVLAKNRRQELLDASTNDDKHVAILAHLSL